MRVLLLAILLIVCAGCAGYGARYREVDIPGSNAEDVWRQVQTFAATRGFRPDPEETDAGRRLFVSRWRGDSVAFRRGNRKRFWAQVVPMPADEGWAVQYYVEIQKVDDTSKNMRPTEEDWEFVGQDRTKESEFLQILTVAFKLDEPKEKPDRAPIGNFDK